MQALFHEKFIVDKKGKRTAVIIEAEVMKIISKGEKEYRSGKLRPIKSLSDLDK